MAQAPDFDLSIIAGDSGYIVRVQASYGVGELRPQPFIPPVDVGALPRAHRDAAAWIKQARITRLAGSEELQAARAFGTALFERLFTGEVLAAFRASRAALPPRTRLRLRLRLPDALTTLPWELVYDKRDNQFLALAPDVMLVRYPELPTPVAPLRMAGPLQVVAVLASPRGDDYAPIRIDREQRRIEAALKSPIDQGALALEIISGPDTLGQLRERLRRPVHVLHILCHGDLDTDSGEGVLIFENVDGEAEPINAELLRLQLQKQQGQTRLVLLNACLGALPAGDDPFSSVGAALLRGGVPAVIAMQFELAEDAAAELTRIFYAELIAGVPSELALTEARLHLYGRYPTRLDWAIPVMFLRADDGVLFEMRHQRIEQAIDQPSAPGLPLLGASDPRLLRAHVAALTDRWEEALALYEELVAAFTLPPGAIAELERARREVWVLWAKAQAEEAAANGNWDAAIILLEQVTKRQPDDAETLERLRKAREEQELATAAREAADMAQAGEWEAVAALLGKIEQRRPGYSHLTIDLAVLRLRSQAGLAYRRAVAQAEQNDWPAVIATLAAVPDAAADQELRGLLAHAEAEIAEQEWLGAADRDQRAVAERPPAEADHQAPLREQRNFEDQLDQSRRLIQASNYDEALDRLEALLTQLPNDRAPAEIVASLIENPSVALTQRLRAGQLAGQYGDPRPGVCTLEPAWCGPIHVPVVKYAIPAGTTEVHLSEFRIARYPITVWQYRQFVNAKGYEQQRWWTINGWRWRKPNTRPYRWSESDWTTDNQPVSGVVWYEAAAFCCWLTAQGHQAGWLQANREIRLPCEAEWEAAAMFDSQVGQWRVWKPPPGELWQNVKETGIGRTSPVGLFPQGASMCGALDMAGNVWEWCCSLFSKYPQQAGPGRSDIDFTSTFLRIIGAASDINPSIRGGDYGTQNEKSGWGLRSRMDPGYRHVDFGFRVVECSRSAV